MASSPKPDGADVPQSPSVHSDDREGEQGTGAATNIVMDDQGLEAEVKEQDRWLPIANGECSLFIFFNFTLYVVSPPTPFPFQASLWVRCCVPTSVLALLYVPPFLHAVPPFHLCTWLADILLHIQRRTTPRKGSAYSPLITPISI